MKKKVIGDGLYQKFTKDYTNKDSLAKVQTKRIDNYSEKLVRVLEIYEAEIGPVIGAYNKNSSEKTMGVRQARNSSRRIQDRRSHQDMVEGLAVECATRLGLNVRSN